MESQSQNPEFRDNPENLHLCANDTYHLCILMHFPIKVKTRMGWSLRNF